MNQPLGFKIFIGIVIGAVLAVAVVGLVLSGTPSQERARQFDARRLSDLQQITYAIDQYWTRNKALPTELSDLLNRREYYVTSVADPRTAEQYEYRATGAKTYELCAVFESEDAASESAAKYPTPYRGPGETTFWRHGVGRTCFTPEATEVPGLIP